jgi:hypothetical protein
VSDKKKQARGPESAFYDTLKGKDCFFWVHGNHGLPPAIIKSPGLPDTECQDGAVRAKMLWVDKYTIGIRLPDGSEDMLNKKFIIRTKRDEENAGHTS